MHIMCRLTPKACAQFFVLFAVDNYQALHAPSGFGQKRTEFSRRMLGVGELRIASLMRILDGPPPAWGADVAALTFSSDYSRDRLEVPARL